MGDYYAGARGDPGFFGSLLGKVTSLASSFIPGGAIVKTGVGAVAGMMHKGGGKIMGGLAKHPVLTAAGAAGAIGLGGGALAEKMMGGAGGCPKGHHISRSKHSKRFGQCVRNRHMNVCNPRALRRSIRRAHGFAKFAMKCIHLTQPKKKGRFGGYKRKRKK